MALDLTSPRAPALGAPSGSRSPAPPDPALEPVDALYRRGFEAAFGDRWEAAYDRFVDRVQREGPVAAARAVGAPDELLPGTAGSPAAAALAAALEAEALRLGADPVRLADARVGVQRVAPHGPSAREDARVAVQDGPQVGDGRVTIDATIFLYGTGATPEVVETYQRGIDAAWGQRPDGRPWTFTSASGETYEVRFRADVRLYDAEDPERAPGLFSGRLSPFNRDNFVRVEPDTERSMVWLGENGSWRAEGRDGATLELDNPAAHEFGHLLGLDDRYTDGGARPGWAGNIMAEPAGRGVVEQRDVDAIVRRHVERFEAADLPAGRVRRSSIAPW